MGRLSVREQFTRTVGTFALIGPPIGGAVMWVWMLFPALAKGSFGDLSPIAFLGALAGSALVALIFGYGFGVIPAAVTGIVCHFFAQSVRSDALWVTLCGLTGASAGALLGFVFSQSLAPVMATCAVPGAIAATACALKLRRSRWAS